MLRSAVQTGIVKTVVKVNGNIKESVPGKASQRLPGPREEKRWRRNEKPVTPPHEATEIRCNVICCAKPRIEHGKQDLRRSEGTGGASWGVLIHSDLQDPVVNNQRLPKMLCQLERVNVNRQRRVSIGIVIGLGTMKDTLPPSHPARDQACNGLPKVFMGSPGFARRRMRREFADQLLALCGWKVHGEGFNNDLEDGLIGQSP